MSKPKVTRLTAEPSRIGPIDLEIALSKAGLDKITIALAKARAARILLGATADYLQIPVPLKPGESEQQVRDWIQDFAFDALDAALEEAAAARQKECAATKLGAV